MSHVRYMGAYNYYKILSVMYTRGMKNAKHHGVGCMKINVAPLNVHARSLTLIL